MGCRIGLLGANAPLERLSAPADGKPILHWPRCAPTSTCGTSLPAHDISNHGPFVRYFYPGLIGVLFCWVMASQVSLVRTEFQDRRASGSNWPGACMVRSRNVSERC